MLKHSVMILVLVCAGPVGASDIVTTNCLIAPERSVDLAGRTTGQIGAIHVDVGDLVTKGQLLAELDAEQEQAALALAVFDAEDQSARAAAQRQLDISKDDLDRARELQKRGILSADGLNDYEADYAARLADLQAAEAALQRAQLQLNLASARVALKEVRSPIDGIVTQRFLEPGEFLNEAVAILRLVRLDRLRVEALADQTRYAEIKAAVSASIEPEIGPTVMVEAAQVTVDPLIDPASGTFRITARIDSGGGAIVSGQQCQITFRMDDR